MHTHISSKTEQNIPNPSFEYLAQTTGLKNYTFIFSRKRHTSWSMVKYPDYRTVISLPESLRVAPLLVKEALLQWTMLKRPHRTLQQSSYLKEKKELEQILFQYFLDQGENRHRTLRSIPSSEINSKESVAAIESIFRQLNQTYFHNNIQSHIRWGRKNSLTSYQSMYVDKDKKNVSCITIAGIYNNPQVPLFALQSVIFHEMLHCAIPPFVKNGRRVIHGKEFRNAEKQFPLFQQWKQWQKRELRYLLRNMQRVLR